MGRKVLEVVRMERRDGDGWSALLGSWEWWCGAALWVWDGGEGRACHGAPASASNWLEDLYSLGLSFSSTKW